MEDPLPKPARITDEAIRYLIKSLLFASFAVILVHGILQGYGWFIFSGSLGLLAVCADAAWAREDAAKMRTLRKAFGIQTDRIQQLEADLRRARMLYNGAAE